MNKLKKLLTGAVLALMLTTSPLLAKGGKGGSSHSHSGHHKSVGRPKTVHVKSYTKKNGKTVHAYNRAAPK